ncbi:unnamed protein product [Boreogadus saida]
MKAAVKVATEHTAKGRDRMAGMEVKYINSLQRHDVCLQAVEPQWAPVVVGCVSGPRPAPLNAAQRGGGVGGPGNEATATGDGYWDPHTSIHLSPPPFPLSLPTPPSLEGVGESGVNCSQGGRYVSPKGPWLSGSPALVVYLTSAAAVITTVATISPFGATSRDHPQITMAV